MKALKFSSKDIENVLFFNKAPEVVIYPFKKSGIQGLSLMSFTVALTSRHLDALKIPVYERLSKVIKKIKNAPVGEQELYSYLASANPSLNSLIFQEIGKVFIEWRDYFYENLTGFAEDVSSKFQWEIAHAVGIEHVMKPPFCAEQQMWIAYTSTWSKSQDQKFMADLAESLHPWMNLDLFKHLEKVKDSKHENVKFEEDRKRMQSGNFGIPDSDKAAIAQFQREAEEDLDIIQ